MKMETTPVMAVATAARGGGGGDKMRCRKHPGARSRGGVCPYYLRDRLLRLCPNCAVRPCPSATSPWGPYPWAPEEEAKAGGAGGGRGGRRRDAGGAKAGGGWWGTRSPAAGGARGHRRRAEQGLQRPSCAGPAGQRETGRKGMAAG
ncbi:unnamed protein product [Urochloa humidicola]